MGAHVTDLGAHDKMSVDEALGIASRRKLKTVLILGYNADGALAVYHDRDTSPSDAVFMLEAAKLSILGALDTEDI